MTTATMINNVGVLLRISREKGEGQDTLLNHRSIAERYCKSKGYKYRIYEEVISGATEVENREALTALLNDIQAGLYDAIFVKDIDRISRDSYYLQYVAKILADYEILIITPEKTYDLNGNDRLMFDMMGAMSSQELRTIKKRQRDGKKEHVRRGQWTQGVTPYGYKRNDDVTSKDYKKLLIDEDEAKVVRMIFDYALNGYGISTIVNKLKGYKTRTYIVQAGNKAGQLHEGKSFGISQVNTILKNPVYKGTITYQVKNKQKQVIEEITVDNAHEAIVSVDMFNKVQQAVRSRLSGDLEVRTRSRGKVLSVLKDLVYCNVCNCKLGFRKDSKQADTVYLKGCSCGNKGITEKRLIAEFYYELAEVEKYFKKEWQKALETPVSDSKDLLEIQLSEVKRKEEKLNKRLKNAKVMRMDGELTKAEYEEAKQEIESELKKIDTAIKDLQRDIYSMDTKKVVSDYEDKLKLLGLIKEQFTSAIKGGKGEGMIIKQLPEVEDMEEANRLLKLLLDKIHYQRYEEKIVGSNMLGEPEVEYDVIELIIEPK